MFRYQYPKLLSALLIASVAGCGGGGGGTTTASPSSTPSTPSSPSTPSTPSTPSSPSAVVPAQQVPPAASITPQQLPPVAPVAAASTMTMSCVDGPTYQCSGNTIIRRDNGVALTRSGVQVYGKSTNDLVTPVADVTKATGLAPASGGTAEVRVAKDSTAGVSAPVLLLSNLGITWDGKNERPQIIETFNPTQGRLQLGANGTLVSTSLPDSANLGFYDFATKGVVATQVNYANNRYFPRVGNPARCDTPGPCRETETTGLHIQAGDWRTGGNTPDFTTASRFHEDGDIHAGNGVPSATGAVTLLPGANGPGVPFPGSKGGRDFNNWSLQYGNLTAWLTQDTVEINDWVGGGRFNEHNNNRRGILAFGDVSLPTAIPVTGTATYSGVAYGWYTGNATDNAVFFRGTATISVSFATRAVVVTLLNTVTNDSSATPVPVTLTAIAAMGTVADNDANYLTGPADSGTLHGGVSGRYFGPVVTTGTSGAGPAELGGALTLTNATTGATAVGGFIARKQ